jgi:hypothetical protein
MEIIYKPTHANEGVDLLSKDTASPYPLTAGHTASPYPLTAGHTASPYPLTAGHTASPYPLTAGHVDATNEASIRPSWPDFRSQSSESKDTARSVEDFGGFYNSGIKNDFLRNRRRLDSENRRNYKEIYSAGILPFSVKGGTVYFLLGKDLENKWSDFGGRSEAQDKGRWDVTATREFYEESVGVVMDISSMLTRLQHRKNYIKVKGKTLSGSPYYMYVVKIPYKETYKETFDNTLGFIRYSNVFDKKYLEKIDLQWVSLETIYAGLDDENNSLVNFPLRRVFKKTLVENLQEITQFSKQFIEITENVWLKK